MILQEIDLCLSNVCNANCIFCPRPDIKHKKQFMTPDLAERIAEEMKGEVFKATHHVTRSVLSENGEPLMNPYFLDIARIMKTTGVSIEIFSNCSLLKQDIAFWMLKENLIDGLHVNIDGLTPESYKAVKGLNLGVVEENLEWFLKLRDEMKARCRLVVHIITGATYMKACWQRFGEPPVRWKGGNFIEERELIRRKWQAKVGPGDYVGIDDVVFFAERKNKMRIPGVYECPQIGRVKSNFFINPEGDVYACCFDFENRLIIGNVWEHSIMEIAESAKRKHLIDLLENGRFDKIGPPCDRVDCCQGMSINEL